MNAGVSCTINSTDSTVESKYGSHSPFEQPFLNTKWIISDLFDFLKPSESDEVDETNEATCGQHEKSENYVLRVVASSVGYSCMRIGSFLFLGDSHMQAVETGKDEQRNKEVQYVIYMYPSKAMLLPAFLSNRRQRWRGQSFTMADLWYIAGNVFDVVSWV